RRIRGSRERICTLVCVCVRARVFTDSGRSDVAEARGRGRGNPRTCTGQLSRKRVQCGLRENLFLMIFSERRETGFVSFHGRWEREGILWVVWGVQLLDQWGSEVPSDSGEGPHCVL
ncbi:hypothetical protein EJ110_NYTH31004, partial [Nymphaea thermarum]